MLRVLSSALLVLGACGSPAPVDAGCDPGSRIACACEGGGEGKRVCGNDRALGGCECLADRELAPPPPAPDVPSPPTPAIDPQREARIDAWVASTRLRGHDNSMAAFRGVRVDRGGDAFTIEVANQFGFRCALDFDASGSPSAMRDCRSRTDREWLARPDVIPLTCTMRERDELCEGDYRLGTTDGYATRATFQIVRPIE